MRRLLAMFRSDDNGQVVIIFAVASLGIFAGLGAAIDLATAYAARQRLSQVATLACQYSTRPSVATNGTYTSAGSGAFQTYVSSINAFATQSLATQKWNAPIQTVGADGVAGHYFTATPAVGGTTATANTPSNPVVDISAAIPTAFAKMLSVSSITVHAHIACQGLSYIPQLVVPPTILLEGFEQPCNGPSGFCQYAANGATAIGNVPTQTFPTKASYVGLSGLSWYVVGYCLETDKVGVINGAVPEGSYAAELDCGNNPNGSQTAGNSSISTSRYLEAGQYELRYFYRSRIDYPNYDPAYVCGSTASDVAWANDTSGISPATGQAVARTNQINVYLDQNIPGTNGSIGSAPLHKTIDGTQYLAGSNLIDMCVYAQNWTERSIKIKVSVPGLYWLTFAADGQNDSYGGQIDYIRLCQEQCPGSLQDNFPSTWINSNLFEDTFDSSIAPANAANAMNVSGNPFSSMGTTGQAGSGWPSQQQTGWYAAPVNQFAYGTQGAYQGARYISLDATSGSGSDRLIAKPFVLDPGYYKVTYDYVSTVNFYPYVTVNYCVSAPPGGPIYPTTAGITAPGTVKNGGNTTAYVDTNIIGLFMAHEGLASHPNGGTTLNQTTNYSNPDGTISATPTVPVDAVNYQNYAFSSTSALLDTCGFTLGWLPRTVYIKITKPGRYWLTFSNQGSTADNYGGAIDDVVLTGLGSPFMSNAPITPLATVPVPAPQHDTSYQPSSYPGFAIVADPFTPPGADL